MYRYLGTAQVQYNYSASSIRHTSVRLGFTMIKLMDHFHQRVKTLGVSQGYRRFATYRHVDIPSFEEFKNNVTAMTAYCISISGRYNNPRSKSQRKNIYKAVISSVRQLTQKVGDLAALHSVSMKSELGLLPSWCARMALFRHDAKGISFINKRFGMKLKGG